MKRSLLGLVMMVGMMPGGCTGDKTSGGDCRTAAECDDGNACTTDSCSGAGVCGHENNTLSCDDDDACTSNDRCAAGVCGGELRDQDADGYVDEACAGDDCSDAEAAIHPGADEVCDDGIDNDCNDLVDLDDVAGCPTGIYGAFNAFCLENFGAEKEPLTYEAQGDALEFTEAGFWTHASENSVAVAFETNLPAKTTVEYGPTDSYGDETTAPERFFYLHLHYLTGLEPDRTYHYRLVATDERGNLLASEDRTIETRTIPGAVYLPGSLEGPPFTLDRDDATYVLTEDIVADRRAFTLAGTNITLDLNGFTVTYDNGAPSLANAEWNEYVYGEDTTFGFIGLWAVSGAILNGTIRQGASNSTGNIGIGFNPVYLGLHEDRDFEIAGVTARYAGDAVSGLVPRGGRTVAIHHNVVQDEGTVIDNRHQGMKGIWTESADADVHHNLVKRVRQQGIMGLGAVRSNEIYVDSWDTNSFAIRPGPGKVTEKNRIFGTGYHLVAIGWAPSTDFLIVRDNFVHLQGDAPTTRSDEYGAQASVNGFRLTQYAGSTEPYKGYLYEGNVIVVKGQNGTTTMRGVQFFSDPYVEGLVFRNNVIKTEVRDSTTTATAACVVGHGLGDRHETQLPVLYEGNRFLSNSLIVRFNDDYAGGGWHHFRNNVLEKFGTRDGFHTIEIGWWIWPSHDNVFIDNEVRGGADLEDSVFNGSAEALLDYSVGHALYLIAETAGGAPLAEAALVVEDSTGETFEAQTDAGGVARVELLEYTWRKAAGETDPSRVAHSDHALRITGFEPYTLSAEQLAVRDNEGSPLPIVFTPQ